MSKKKKKITKSNTPAKQSKTQDTAYEDMALALTAKEQSTAEQAPETPEKQTAEKEQKEKKKRASIGVQIAKYATALVVVLVLFWFGFTTVVREGNCAVIMRFGEVREVATEPGLYFKLPWPFETTVTYDSRLQYLESNRIEVLTTDSSNIIIHAYVAWQIADPVLYHNSTGLQEGGAATFIRDQVDNATNLTISGYKLSNLVSLDPEEIMNDQIQREIFQCMATVCRDSYGIEIKDVSFLRLSFPDANLTQVFSDMRTARQSQINAILAEAYKTAQEITDDANLKSEEIKAEGKLEAAEITKQTEMAVAEIHAAAMENSYDLYSFLRELDTMVASVNGDTVMIININDPPFNVLTKYADSMSREGDETVIEDLEYMLSQMTEEDRNTLVEGIRSLMESYQTGEGETGGTEAGG